MTTYNLQDRFTPSELPVDADDDEAIAALADWINTQFDAFLVEDTTTGEWLLFVETEIEAQSTPESPTLQSTGGAGRFEEELGTRKAGFEETLEQIEEPRPGDDRFGVGDTA